MINAHLGAIRRELDRLGVRRNGGIEADARAACCPGECEGPPLPGDLVRFADAGGSECYALAKAALDALRELPDGADYDSVWRAIPEVEVEVQE